MNILMPQLGETVAEGRIIKWFKSAGDMVKPGDNLFEIETDKVSMEVPATEAGVLSEIRVLEGEVAPVGAIVGIIGAAAGAAASAQTLPAPSTAKTSPTPSVAAEPGSGRGPPRALRIVATWSIFTPRRSGGIGSSRGSECERRRYKTEARALSRGAFIPPSRESQGKCSPAATRLDLDFSVPDVRVR